jgi:2-oxoglutarate ferredoxin oxidoreductase subunit beta
MNATATLPKLTRRDFASDQAVRWCPGCGDYAILAQVQKMLPELGIPRENLVFISGIGCSSRFPYYMNTFGIHSIHGRAPTLASGLKCARPDLHIWVVTGDGDALAIGGNHFLHTLRRNIDINILLFNNRIYGLTKGQYSPTSEFGKRTKSSPDGSIENPINPIGVAIGAEASFIARTVDSFQKQMGTVLERAARHSGTTLIEVAQNCVIFNDGAWSSLTDPDTRADNVLFLEHGQPMRFGKNMEKGLRLNGLAPEVVSVDDVGEENLLVHDESAEEPTLAYLLSRMGPPDFPTPVGIFRAVEKPVYDQQLTRQVEEAKRERKADLNALYHQGETWAIECTSPEAAVCHSCHHPNLPGADECEVCLSSLTNGERPIVETENRVRHSLHHDKVSVLKPKQAITLKSTASVDEAVDTMRTRKIGCILITGESGKLRGIFTERDVLVLLCKPELTPAELTLEDVMTHHPETIGPRQSLARAVHRMMLGDFRYLPLVDKDGRPVGIVNSRDLINHIAAIAMAKAPE